MFSKEPVDLDRLVQRVVHYAKAGEASDEATRQMVDMLQSPEGRAIISIPADEVNSLLVTDVYKIRMQNMYSQFMTGRSDKAVWHSRAGNLPSCNLCCRSNHPWSFIAGCHLLTRGAALASFAGVTADFALKIRRCKAHVNSKHVLADMRQQQPEVYRY